MVTCLCVTRSRMAKRIFFSLFLLSLLFYFSLSCSLSIPPSMYIALPFTSFPPLLLYFYIFLLLLWFLFYILVSLPFLFFLFLLSSFLGFSFPGCECNIGRVNIGRWYKPSGGWGRGDCVSTLKVDALTFHPTTTAAHWLTGRCPN